MHITASEPIGNVAVYGIDGTQLAALAAPLDAEQMSFPVNVSGSVVIVSVTLRSGTKAVRKVLLC